MFPETSQGSEFQFKAFSWRLTSKPFSLSSFESINYLLHEGGVSQKGNVCMCQWCTAIRRTLKQLHRPPKPCLCKLCPLTAALTSACWVTAGFRGQHQSSHLFCHAKKNSEKDQIADFSFCVVITFKVALNLCFCFSVGSCTLQLTTFQCLQGFVLYSELCVML